MMRGLLLMIAALGAAQAETVHLPNGVTVKLGRPVEVTAQVSWGETWLDPKGQSQTSYAHFFPGIGKFPGGNVIATYATDLDMAGPIILSAFQISHDSGATWDRRYAVIPEHNPLIFIPQKGDSLLGLPSDINELTPGDERNFTGPAYLFEDGGSRFTLIPKGVKILDWPWPIEVEEGPRPRNEWHISVCVTGAMVRVGNRVLATIYGTKKGEDHYRTMLMASTDNGWTWHYYSTVATTDKTFAADIGKPRFEGPNEPAIISLKDGELMDVFRVGSGPEWKVRRSYSRDQGKTWSEPDALPAHSVMPALVRTENGVIALSTGRPGIDLWISGDDRGRKWSKIDLIAHHNASVRDPKEKISSYERGEYTQWETTSYTKMVEVAPNRILLIYERDAVIRPPERAPATLQDKSRVYVVPIEVSR